MFSPGDREWFGSIGAEFSHQVMPAKHSPSSAGHLPGMGKKQTHGVNQAEGGAAEADGPAV